MIQINQEPFGKVHFSTLHLTLSKPCCNDAQPAIFVNSVHLGWFYCCSIAINSFSGAVVCFTYLQPFEAMNMNFSYEICAVQVRTTENKNRIEPEFSLIKRLPIDSHVQRPMCSHMKMLCAMWTHTGCCCCCSRVVISHHALLSCVVCLFHSHSLSFRIGFLSMWDYDQRKRNALIFNAMRPLQVVGLSLTLFSYRCQLLCVCAKGECEEGKRRSEEKRKK